MTTSQWSEWSQVFRKSDYLATYSPFLALFWAAWSAALAATVIPLGRLRVRVTVGLITVMLLMLVIHLAIGLSLERGARSLVAGPLADNGWLSPLRSAPPESAVLEEIAYSIGKTPWFWVVFAAVIIAGASEVVLRKVWSAGREPTINLFARTVFVAAAFLWLATCLTLAACLVRVVLWRPSPSAVLGVVGLSVAVGAAYVLYRHRPPQTTSPQHLKS
jgi:hypothetical protein